MKVNRKFLRSAERLSLSAIAKDSAAQRVYGHWLRAAACSCTG